MVLVKKPILIMIFAIILVLSFPDSYGGIVEFKKAYEINSPQVCGDRLCSQTQNDSTQVKKDRKNTDTPLGQFQLGISLDKIRCKAGYELVIKEVNWHPACVKPSNIEKLAEIGWAASKTEQEEIIAFAKSGYSFDQQNRFEIPEKKVSKKELEEQIDTNFGLSIKSDIQNLQRYLIFTGYGWLGFHNVQITITNDYGFYTELETKTTDRGDLFMPWAIPDSVIDGMYNVVATDTKHTFEITIPITPKEQPIIEETKFSDDKCSNETFPIDWSGCDLYGKVLTKVDLRYANIRGANLYGIILSHKDLTGADFTSAILKQGNLDGAILRGASFINANLVNTEIRNADLADTNFINAKLFRTDFTNSNLTNADLRHSTLTYAILSYVDLKGADMEGAGTWETNLNHCYNHPVCN